MSRARPRWAYLRDKSQAEQQQQPDDVTMLPSGAGAQRGGAMRGNSRYRALRRALSRRIAGRSLATMLVVGSILNAINQGDAILSSGTINWWKLGLTYCVPFCIATFGAYSAYRAGETM